MSPDLRRVALASGMLREAPPRPAPKPEAATDETQTPKPQTTT